MPSLIRGFALAIVVGAVISAQHLSRSSRADAAQALSFPCDVGAYHCVELKDPLMEDAIRGTGVSYLYRMYGKDGAKIELFAAAGPVYSHKDPSSCLRLQGWVPIRNEVVTLETDSGPLRVRRWLLASPLSQPRQTIVAVGFWQWNRNQITTSPAKVRFYSLLDDLFFKPPRLISVQIYRTLPGVSYVEADLDAEFSPLREFIRHWEPISKDDGLDLMFPPKLGYFRTTNGTVGPRE